MAFELHDLRLRADDGERELDRHQDERLDTFHPAVPVGDHVVACVQRLLHGTQGTQRAIVVIADYCLLDKSDEGPVLEAEGMRLKVDGGDVTLELHLIEKLVLLAIQPGDPVADAQLDPETQHPHPRVGLVTRRIRVHLHVVGVDVHPDGRPIEFTAEHEARCEEARVVRVLRQVGRGALGPHDRLVALGERGLHVLDERAEGELLTLPQTEGGLGAERDLEPSEAEGQEAAFACGLEAHDPAHDALRLGEGVGLLDHDLASGEAAREQRDLGAHGSLSDELLEVGDRDVTYEGQGSTQSGACGIHEVAAPNAHDERGEREPAGGPMDTAQRRHRCTPVSGVLALAGTGVKTTGQGACLPRSGGD